LIHELARNSFEIPKRPLEVTELLVSGDLDLVTPPDLARALAAEIDAEYRPESAAGHALPVDSGWEQRVSAVHRWIVQSVGKRLLALFDESFEE